jgi:KDO2-lipid IV(A) lauroyltransferase
MDEIVSIEKGFYHHLCDCGVETVRLLAISPNELQQRMAFTNPEVLLAYTETNTSILLFASHQFNWEWLLASGCLSLPAKVDFVYQAQSSDLFNRFLFFCRTRFGGYPIQREFVARELAKRKNEVRLIAVVADQFPGLASDKRYWTTFLHQDTAFFQAINQMAALTQYPSFYPAVRRVKRGFYEVELVQISTPPYDRHAFHAVDHYTRALEGAIAKEPENWLWSHKRWKRPRTSGE